MSGELDRLQSFYVPAPIDGLNLRASPYEIGPTEALVLDNYLIYDDGILECGNWQSLTQPTTGTVGQLIFFKTLTGTTKQLILMANKVYVTSNDNWGSPSDITGGLSLIVTDTWRFCFFKKRIFIVNGADLGLIYDIGAGTIANDTFTGLASYDASQVCTYKQRLYFVQKNSTSVWYGGVGSIAGVLVEFDIGEFLENYGAISFATSWSVNQGNVNEQIFVMVTDSGEVLIYSGDYPAAANWTILTRVTIPTPLGNQAFIRFGQDVLIVTVRGVVSLAAIISGNYESEQYYNVSLKLGTAFGSVNVPPVRDPRQPFIYFASSASDYIYALNFERGAWSRIQTGVTGTTISAMSFWDKGTAGENLNVSFSDGTSRRMEDGSGNSVGHYWKTGLLGADKKQKHVKMLRVLGRNTAGSPSVFANTVGIAMDGISLNPSVSLDTRSRDDTGTDYTEQEIAVGALGKRPSLYFLKTSAGERNQISGVDVFFEPGGAY